MTKPARPPYPRTVPLQPCATHYNKYRHWRLDWLSVTLCNRTIPNHIPPLERRPVCPECMSALRFLNRHRPEGRVDITKALKAMVKERKGLLDKPMLNEAELDRREGRPYRGPIREGAIFAWEPDLPYARQLCIVSKVDGTIVHTMDFPARVRETWNDIARFREAVVPTMLKPQTVKPSIGGVPPFPGMGLGDNI